MGDFLCVVKELDLLFLRRVFYRSSYNALRFNYTETELMMFYHSYQDRVTKLYLLVALRTRGLNASSATVLLLQFNWRVLRRLMTNQLSLTIVPLDLSTVRTGRRRGTQGNSARRSRSTGSAARTNAGTLHRLVVGAVWVNGNDCRQLTTTVTLRGVLRHLIGADLRL